jgi:hypothetical protein
MKRVKGDLRFYRPDWVHFERGSVDASDYLSLLLNIKTAEHAHQFVNRYGSPREELGEHGAFYMSMKHLRDLQKELEVVAKSPAEALVSKLEGLFLILRLEAGSLIAVCRENAESACFEQLFFEKQAGTRFGWCERRDCAKFFRCTNKHKRKYCSPECGHLVAVRKSRAKKGG